MQERCRTFSLPLSPVTSMPSKKKPEKKHTVVHLGGDLLDVDVDPVEDAPLLDDEDAWFVGWSLERGKGKK